MNYEVVDLAMIFTNNLQMSVCNCKACFEVIRNA